MTRALKTDTERVEWFRRYRTALRRYLQRGPSARLQTALKAGHQAVTLGLETLDVARLHEQALTALAPPGGSSGSGRHEMAERAKAFFTEAIVPVEATHRAALNAEVRIGRLTQTLQRRRDESSASAGQQEQAIAQRQALEAVLKKTEDQHATLLGEAQGLQEHLRHRTHELLSAQEDERENTSRTLRDEIAQTLLAIDITLLALKTSAGADTEKLEKALAKAQRLVGQSDQGCRR